MRTIALTSAATALLAATSYGDIIYAVPGMTAAKAVSGDNIDKTESRGNYWEYEVTGYSWQIVAGTPQDGEVDEDGYYVDGKQREAEIVASLNGRTIANETFTTDKAYNVERTTNLDGSVDLKYVAASKSGTVTFDEPIVVSNELVKFIISQTTDTPGDSGTYIEVHGAAVKHTPDPSGALKPFDLDSAGAENYYLAAVGTKPDIEWTITLDGGAPETTPDAKQLVDEWVASAPAPAPEEDPDHSDDSCDVPKNKTNKGHGNNEDGIDADNPGKAAEKWEEKYGVVDNTNPDGTDDESKGGGAAPSKNKNK
jgi:hypothetical protein